MRDAEIPLRVTKNYNLVQDWELVLIAQGLSPNVRPTRDGFLLSVPEEEVEKALAGLSAYEKENTPQRRQAAEPMGPAGMRAGLIVAGMLLVFYVITVLSNPRLLWFERGSADAGRILEGELWRAVTALTLHADMVHAVSNATAIALFLGAVAGMLGPGLACALVLLAGAGGNFVNALVHGSAHISIGASTAVFGAVGILGGLGMARRRTTIGRRRAWVPVAAALALLAMLGAEGENVDVLAHFFGFLLGVAWGILIAFVTLRRPRAGVQWACGSAAIAVLVWCWIVALY